jgi:hypothetical protein
VSATTIEGMTKALVRNGISPLELIAATEARGCPEHKAREFVAEFLSGEGLKVIVAEALIDIIVSQQSQVRH